MSTLGWIVLATGLGGVVSAALAALVLLLPAPVRARGLPHLVSFAIGALLGAALLALLPHAIERAGAGGAHGIGLALAGGVLLFFTLEKFVLWRHCHGEHHDDPHGQSAAWLVLAGDALHNALDGVLIAAAFLTDTKLGVVTAIAVAAHEIPQEVGDFAVLLNAGWSRTRALAFNVATGLAAVVGGVVAFMALRPVLGVLPWVLAVSAASLLYVAVADLIPGLHRRFDARSSLLQIALITAGVLIIALVERSAH